MSEGDVVAVNFSVVDAGKHVKATKKRYMWAFCLERKYHVLIYQFSFISGKVQLAINGRILKRSQFVLGQSFNHSFSLDGHHCVVVQCDDDVEFRIDNRSFMYLLNKEKTSQAFSNHEQLRDFILEPTQSASEKIKLNINGMKKKKKSLQTQNWKEMGENSQLPNYFQFCQTQKEIKTSTTLNQSSKKIQNAVNLMEEFSNIKTDTLNQIPSSQSEDKTNNFYTIQELFATENNKMDETPYFKSDEEEQLSTIQNLFKTIKFEQGTQHIQGKDQDYNTMRNLFGTVFPPSTLQSQPSEEKILQSIDFNKPISQNVMPVPSEFNTLQNLFKTQMLKKECENTNMGEFNTMQALFKTNNQMNCFENGSI